jgi:N-6 DNA methylase
MINHYTPVDVARVLAKHLPRNVSTLLEPAIGTGLLLEPILDRLSSSTRIVGVDIDSKALELVRSSISTRHKGPLELIRANFFTWAKTNTTSPVRREFDCVLMNPPFLARRERFVRLRLSDDFPSATVGGFRSMPVEAAFLARGIGVLRPRGRLLGIFPASLVSGYSTAWLRDLVLDCGAVLYVHELPRFTFKDVEARIYLFVFEKMAARRTILLCNHDLATPEVLMVRRSDLSARSRFDFAFHKARQWQESFRTSTLNLKWRPLKDAASIVRGAVPSPGGRTFALHTTDYRNGFWQKRLSAKLIRDFSEAGIRKGDILVKRVGRNCANSFGRAVGHVGSAVSDCVLIVRPKNVNESTKVLFALRFLLSCDFGAALIEHGSGASYLTEADLKELLVPLNLAERNVVAFQKYKKAVELRQFSEMQRTESSLQLAYRFYTDPVTGN